MDEYSQKRILDANAFEVAARVMSLSPGGLEELGRMHTELKQQARCLLAKYLTGVKDIRYIHQRYDTGIRDSRIVIDERNPRTEMAIMTQEDSDAFIKTGWSSIIEKIVLIRLRELLQAPDLACALEIGCAFRNEELSGDNVFTHGLETAIGAGLNLAKCRMNRNLLQDAADALENGRVTALRKFMADKLLEQAKNDLRIAIRARELHREIWPTRSIPDSILSEGTVPGPKGGSGGRLGLPGGVERRPMQKRMLL